MAASLLPDADVAALRRMVMSLASPPPSDPAGRLPVFLCRAALLRAMALSVGDTPDGRQWQDAAEMWERMAARL